jgi:hypothetical protein
VFSALRSLDSVICCSIMDANDNGFDWSDVASLLVAAVASVSFDLVSAPGTPHAFLCCVGAGLAEELVTSSDFKASTTSTAWSQTLVTSCSTVADAAPLPFSSVASILIENRCGLCAAVLRTKDGERGGMLIMHLASSVSCVESRDREPLYGGESPLALARGKMAGREPGGEKKIKEPKANTIGACFILSKACRQ